MLFGAVLIVAGLFLLVLPKTTFHGKLPGDILLKRESFTFSLPLATSIVVSLFLHLLKLPAVPTCRDRECARSWIQ